MKFILVFIYSFSIFALPKSIDIIFLSASKKQSLFFNTSKLTSIASNEEIECVETEDGCFNPQFGIVRPNKNGSDKKIEDLKVEVKTINSLETNLIDCKEGNYFDIFCGKAKPNEVNVNVDYEVWVDTSASLRNVDWNADPSFCSRRSFVERLKKSCGLEIKTFDTSIKGNADPSALCLTYGLNDTNRLIKWIEGSEAKKLIIITDIDEANTQLRDYIFKIGANIHGADYGDVDNKSILDLVSKFDSACQKKK